jgi:uncharacterized protein (DUF1330 family)
MRPQTRLTLGILGGIAIGLAGATVLRATQNAPHGYLVAEVDITDPKTFETYRTQVPGTLAPYHGHFVIRGGKITPLEGEPPRRLSVVEFESVEQAHAWYDSKAYQAIAPIRQRSAKTRSFIIEGAAE